MIFGCSSMNNVHTHVCVVSDLGLVPGRGSALDWYSTFKGFHEDRELPKISSSRVMLKYHAVPV